MKGETGCDEAAGPFSDSCQAAQVDAGGALSMSGSMCASNGRVARHAQEIASTRAVVLTHHTGYQKFLTLLRAARKAAGATQVELAERIRNRQVFVSKLERGDRRMDVVDFLEYCEAAGIDAVALFKSVKEAIDRGPRSRIGKLAIQGGRTTPQRRRR